MGREILDKAPPPADERLSYGRLPQQFGELSLPKTEGPHPVAMLLHGGFWRAAFDLKHMGHMAAALVRQGVACWNVEYRKIGEDGGGWPGTLDDVAEAARFLAKIAPQRRLDLRRAVAIGFSAGGHLALWLGNEPGLDWRGVVALGAVADLRRAWDLGLSNRVAAAFLGGSPDQVPDRYRAADPAARLPARVRQRLLHGVSDDVVPIEIVRGYARRAGDGVRLTEIPAAGHFELIDPDTAAWTTVKETVLELLS